MAFLFFGIIFLALFSPVERESWRNKKEYQERLKESFKSIPEQDFVKGKLKAGWAKVSIIPGSPIPIASYGIREEYKEIHDSIWCRAFVLDNGYVKVAMVTMDLLIFPPIVYEKVKSILKDKGYSEHNLFFSANHTHNAPGGWAGNLGGRILAGKYNEEYVTQLVQAVVNSVSKSEEDIEDVSVGFEKFDAKQMISNRYSQKEEDLDHWLRLVKIQKKSGSKAAIISYAAHPNNIDSEIDEISGDYAGLLVSKLERETNIDFAAFFAGAVGAHSCAGYKGKDFEAIEEISDYLGDIIKTNFDHVVLKDSAVLHSFKLPVFLGDPQLKIFKGWKIRPWLFHFLLGKHDVFISALKIDDIVFIGTPCDFGGELVKNFNELCEENNLKLSITSFNGAYIGYIVPDEYYDIDKMETRDMSWYGPHNADYFVEIIKRTIKKLTVGS